jgi:TusA-related sulfurtransferase
VSGAKRVLADARAGDIVTVASEGPIAGNSIFAWCELDY